MSVSVFDRQSVLFRGALAACIVSALVLIWDHRFLPMSDYPDWVYQGWILSRILHGGAHPLYHFKPYLPTHAGVTILIALCDYAFRPETSAKLVLSIAVCSFAIGSSYLLKASGGSERNPILFVPLLFIFDTWFFTGEIDYYLALAGFFFFSGYLLRRADTPTRISPWVVLATLCAIFIAHLMVYVTCCAVCVAIVVVHPSAQKARRVLLPALASTPILAWYVLARAMSHNLGSKPFVLLWTPRQMANNLVEGFSLFHAFPPWFYADSTLMHISGMCNLCAAGGFLGLFAACAVMWIRGARSNSAYLFAALLCLVGYVAGGYAIAGVFGAERLTCPAAWLALAWLAGMWIPGGLVRSAAICALAAAMAIQGVYLHHAVGRVSTQLDEAYQRLARAQSAKEFCSIYEQYFQQSWGKPHRPGWERCVPLHANVIRLPYYLYIERKQEAPIFDAGMFDYSGPGNNNNLCM